MKLLRTAIVLMVIVIGVHSECSSVPKCTCSYDGEDVEVEEQTQSTEVLAGAVGALSSAVVSGGGIGIWHLLKSRTPGVPDTDSLASSEDCEGEGETKKRKGPPPPYGARPRFGEEETAFRTPNIYSAGMNDHLSHRVTASPRNVMTMDDF